MTAVMSRHAQHPEFPGYIFTELGEVFSFRHRGKLCYGKAWKELRGRIIKAGYRYVDLRHFDGRLVQKRVNRAVLEAFKGAAPEDTECRHLDGNKLNNALSNLAWGTRRENVADKIRHNTQPRGEHQGLAKLTDSDVRAIRRLRGQTGMSFPVLAKRYGVDQKTIYNIVNYKTWKHVEGEAADPNRPQQ